MKWLAPIFLQQRLYLLVAFLCLGFPAIKAISQTNYAIQDLGASVPNTTFYAKSINNHGQVVGLALPASSPEDGFWHAFLFSEGIIHELDIPRLSRYARLVINNRSQIAGCYVNDKGQNRPFLYEKHGLIQLPVFNEASDLSTYMSVNSINDKTEIVGSLNWPTMEGDAFLYRNSQGKMIEDKHGRVMVANGINNLGDIVGGAELSGATNTTAFLLHKGQLKNLGTLGGRFSFASALNEANQVVGEADVAGSMHAFFYSSGRMKNLGTLGDFDHCGVSAHECYSAANSINNRGQVVGDSVFQTKPKAGESKYITHSHAFLFYQGQMRDLNTLLPSNSGWILTTAIGINDKGQIAGNGLHNGKESAYLLSPSPSISPSLSRPSMSKKSEEESRKPKR